jgi:type IV fimbrial biogenesis protein FimT
MAASIRADFRFGMRNSAKTMDIRRGTRSRSQHNPRMRPTRSYGISLVELCFALFVAAALAGLAAPSFRASLRAAAVRAAAYDLMGDLQQTRGSAILEGRSAVLCLTNPAGICGGSPGSGWRAFPTADPSRPLAERLLADGLVVRGSRARLAFWPGALAADTGTLTICDTRGITAPRAIVISRSGRPRFTVPAAEACEA